MFVCRDPLKRMSYVGIRSRLSYVCRDQKQMSYIGI
jgi:hypothetical protein